MESRICCFLLLLFYCEGWGAVLSGLLSWAAGGLLLQGPLFPRAGELLKSSSSSRPLVASYCVFSRRVIRRSSSSPNSPPIRVGSPTTITSCREAETWRTNLQFEMVITTHIQTESHFVTVVLLKGILFIHIVFFRDRAKQPSPPYIFSLPNGFLNGFITRVLLRKEYANNTLLLCV